MNSPKYLIIHHTGGTDANPLADTSSHDFWTVNEYHRQKWNFRSSLGYYIGYHYFIDKFGFVLQGRADTDEGAHTIGWNESSLGICLAGNFDLTYPTPKQVQSLKDLLVRKSAEYNININNIVPHRVFSSKTCYGRNLSDNWAANLVRENLYSRLEQLKIALFRLLEILKGRYNV